MKKTILFLFLILFGATRGKTQVFDIEQLLLDVEKLSQLKHILQDLKDGYHILQSGYSAIRDIAQGSFSLHKAYLDGLLAVSPTVSSYERITEITDMQVLLVKRYQSAWGRFRQDDNLHPGELAALNQVLGAILNEASEDIDQLLTVVTAGIIRASDAERLEEIDSLFHRMRVRLVSLDEICNRTILLSLQRSVEKEEIYGLRRWLDLTK